MHAPVFEALSAVFALNVGEEPPIKSATVLFVDRVKLTFTFPMFSRTNCPFCAAHVPSPWLPSLFIVAPVCPAFTAPLPKSNSDVVKFNAPEPDMVTLTIPVALSVTASPVIFVPMKKREIKITAMAMYPMIPIVLTFMTVLYSQVCLLPETE